MCRETVAYFICLKFQNSNLIQGSGTPISKVYMTETLVLLMTGILKIWISSGLCWQDYNTKFCKTLPPGSKGITADRPMHMILEALSVYTALTWHHVNSLVNQINCCCSECSLLVYRCARSDEMTHISNMDTHLLKKKKHQPNAVSVNKTISTAAIHVMLKKVQSTDTRTQLLAGSCKHGTKPSCST